MSRHSNRGDRLDGVVWGVFLILIGVVFLANRYDRFPYLFLTSWWTYLVMAMGVTRLITARSAKRVGDGVSLSLIGVYLWVSANDFMGLGWHNSWPLALIAVGFGAVARAIASIWLPDRIRREAVVDSTTAAPSAEPKDV